MKKMGARDLAVLLVALASTHAYVLPPRLHVPAARIVRMSIAPTGEDLDAAMDTAAKAEAEAIAARHKAKELAEMPFFKKTEQEMKEQRLRDAKEWREKADVLEQRAIEARSMADTVLAQINEQEEVEAAEQATERDDAYEAPSQPMRVEHELNGSEDRGGDINGILSITAPTVLAVLALPALANWMNQQF